MSSTDKVLPKSSIATAHSGAVSFGSKARPSHFPDGTRVLGTHREEGIDDYLGVKVELPARALSGFLASTPVAKESFRPGNGGLLGPDQDGVWDPNKQPNLRAGQALLPGARALNIGYDDSRAGVAVVFVVNHGT